jgi:predicted esterase
MFCLAASHRKSNRVASSQGVAFLSEVGAVRDSVYDAKAAVRYAVRHAAELGIDPHRIAVTGGSAGAIISASLPFVEEGDSGNPGFPSNVSAAISISGTIWPFLLKAADSSIAGATVPPYFDVHGDEDNRVYPFLGQMTFNYLHALGVTASRNQLAIVRGGGHVPWGDSPEVNAMARDVLRPHLVGFLAEHLRLHAGQIAC